MSRPVLATPLYVRRLDEFLDEFAEKGAVRLIERLQASHRDMLANLARFEQMAPARRRRVGSKRVTVREYLLDAGAREFLVLYWVPPEPSAPVLLLNIRIGGQNRFRWRR